MAQTATQSNSPIAQLDHDGLVDYLAEQDGLLEVNGEQMFEPALWVREMAGDGARFERVACGAWCEGCPQCFDPVLDAEV